MISFIYDGNGWSDESTFYLYDGKVIIYSSNSMDLTILTDPAPVVEKKIQRYLNQEIRDENGHGYFQVDGEPKFENIPSDLYKEVKRLINEDYDGVVMSLKEWLEFVGF